MIRTIALMSLTATPALAHGGAHVHPHGAGLPIILLAAALAALLLILSARR